MPIAEKYPLPDKLTTYNSMEGLIQHFELIMPNRGFEMPDQRVYASVEAPTASWAITWSPTAPSSPGGSAPGRRRSSTSAIFPQLIKDHLLADVVAVLGSLNIIAAELDR